VRAADAAGEEDAHAWGVDEAPTSIAMATESWGEHRWPHSSMPAPLRELPHAVDVAPESDRQNIDRVGRVVDAVHHPIGTQGAAVRPAPTTVVMNPAEVVEHHAGADTVVVVAKELKHDSSECCLDLGPDVF